MNSMQGLRQDPTARSSESFGAQAPVALLGLAAIAVIALVNLNARPAAALPPAVIASACVECGTVVAIRRSAHASPVFFVEIQMLDGSTPFRRADAWKTIRGRSWAIHDGILGEPWHGIRMYKQVGKHAGMDTFPGGEY